MKRILTYLLFFACHLICKAQQEPAFGQFSFYWQHYNPAYIGRVEEADLRKQNKDWGRRNEDQYANFLIIARSQWTGFKGAPTSGGFLFGYPFAKGKMVAGLSAQQSSLGATRYTSLKATYSYRVVLSSSSFLSIGAYAGAVEYKVDGNKIMVKDDIDSDPSFTNNVRTVYAPDLGIGTAFKISRLRLGVSLHHITKSRLPLGQVSSSASSFEPAKLYRQYYFMGHYTFQPERHFSIEPSFLIKYVAGAPVQGDVNVNWVFDHRYWIGGAYSTGNSIAALAGICLYPGKDKVKHEVFRIGYAYHFITSPYNRAMSTHELFLSFSFRTQNDEHYQK